MINIKMKIESTYNIKKKKHVKLEKPSYKTKRG